MFVYARAHTHTRTRTHTHTHARTHTHTHTGATVQRESLLRDRAQQDFKTLGHAFALRPLVRHCPYPLGPIRGACQRLASR